MPGASPFNSYGWSEADCGVPSRSTARIKESFTGIRNSGKELRFPLSVVSGKPTARSIYHVVSQSARHHLRLLRRAETTLVHPEPANSPMRRAIRSEEHTSELQS